MSDGPAAVIVNEAGTNVAEVKAASTAAVATDKALVVAVSPNNTVPVSAVALPLPTGAATAANQTTLGNQTTKINDGTNTAAVSAANALKVDGSAVTQPVSAASLPLPTGAATSALQTQPGVDIGDVTINNAGGAAAVNVQDGGNSITVDATSLPLPTGAATETTLAAVSGKLPATLGQKAMAASLAVVVASDQSAVPVSAASLPLPAGAATEATLAAMSLADNAAFTDGTSRVQAAGFVFDEVAGTALTENDVAAARVDSKRAVVHVIEDETTRGRRLTVTAANAAKVDGSAVTQPISAASLPLPTGAATETTLAAASAKLPATLGQKAMAASLAVVVASDQSAVPISAASLPLPTGAATETTLAAISTKTPALGQAAMAASSPVVIASNQSAVPVSAASLPLPTGAATETTLATRLADATFTGRINTLGQKTSAASTPVVVASDQPNIPVTLNNANAYTGVSAAIRTLGGGTAGSLIKMEATTYNEPSSQAQRSISSSSANDSAAGTGMRTVAVYYYKNDGTGPFSEVVTLNGTTPVNTVATDIRFIEGIFVRTVGSVGANVGTITLYGSTGGGGGVVGSIGVGNLIAGQGDGITLWAHHYTPITKHVEFSTVTVGVQSGGNGTSAQFLLRLSQPLTANAGDALVGDVMLVLGAFTRTFGFRPTAEGFCKTTGYVIPGVNGATVSMAFDWSET